MKVNQNPSLISREDFLKLDKITVVIAMHLCNVFVVIVRVMENLEKQNKKLNIIILRKKPDQEKLVARSHGKYHLYVNNTTVRVWNQSFGPML